MTPVPKVFEFVDQRYITQLNISITTLLYRETEYITITYAIKSYFIPIRFYCFRKVMVLPPYFRTIAKIFKILDWK